MFPFSFKLPNDLPSSFTFGKLAALKYTVLGQVHVEYNKSRFRLTQTQEAHILENLPKSIHENSKSLKATTKGAPFLGRKGNVKLSALLQKSRFASGDNIYVAVKVRNTTARSVRGLKIELIRRIIIVRNNSGDENSKLMSENVVEAKFNQIEYKYRPGQERTSVLNLNIPVNHH